MGANPVEAVRRQLSDQSDGGFFGTTVKVGVDALIGLAVVALRVLAAVVGDLVGVDKQATVFDPGCELLETLGVVVGRSPLHEVADLVLTEDEVDLVGETTEVGERARLGEQVGGHRPGLDHPLAVTSQ
jgi:hypothetical protein